jgi:uncharacterized protein
MKNDGADTTDLRALEGIRELLDAGFLSENRPTQIYNKRAFLAREYIENNLNSIILQVTQDCNLRCAYCPYSGDGRFDRTHSNKAMDSDTARRAIDFLVSGSTYAESIHVGFYGGEPLLNFSLIKTIAEYATERFNPKRVNFGLTTNGTIMNSEILDFFSTYDCTINVSLDGPSHIHNKNRRFAHADVGSHANVVRTLSALSERGIPFGISAVWDLEESITEINAFFSGNDLYTNVNIEPVLTGRIGTGYAISEENEYADAAETVQAMLWYVGELTSMDEQKLRRAIEPITNIEKMLVPRDTVPDVFHHAGPCIPGSLRLLVDTAGNMYPCEKISGESTVMQIGNIDTGVDFEKISQIMNIGKLTEKQCKTCWAMNLCSICGMWADVNEEVFSVESKLKRCDFIKNQAKSTLKEYVILKSVMEVTA